MGADAAPSQKAQELTRAFAQATAALLNNQLGPVMIDGAELRALRKVSEAARVWRSNAKTSVGFMPNEQALIAAVDALEKGGEE